MMKIKGNTRGMVYASAIAAIYVVLTLVSLGKFLESRNMQKNQPMKVSWNIQRSRLMSRNRNIQRSQLMSQNRK